MLARGGRRTRRGLTHPAQAATRRRHNTAETGKTLPVAPVSSAPIPPTDANHEAPADHAEGAERRRMQRRRQILIQIDPAVAGGFIHGRFDVQIHGRVVSSAADRGQSNWSRTASWSRARRSASRIAPRRDHAGRHAGSATRVPARPGAAAGTAPVPVPACPRPHQRRPHATPKPWTSRSIRPRRSRSWCDPAPPGRRGPYRRPAAGRCCMSSARRSTATATCGAWLGGGDDLHRRPCRCSPASTSVCPRRKSAASATTWRILPRLSQRAVCPASPATDRSTSLAHSLISVRVQAISVHGFAMESVVPVERIAARRRGADARRRCRRQRAGPFSTVPPGADLPGTADFRITPDPPMASALPAAGPLPSSRCSAGTPLPAPASRPRASQRAAWTSGGRSITSARSASRCAGRHAGSGRLGGLRGRHRQRQRLSRP